MYIVWCVLVFNVSLVLVSAIFQNDAAGQQIVNFRERTPGPIGILTTAGGAPVRLRDTRALNRNLLLNEHFLDTLTHLHRERIPERIVHAKAGGAFGYFEVTHDISHICRAKLFSHVGKKTPLAARFSPVVVERGGIDTSRDARGFALKFYTEEGNFDVVGFSTPVFALKEPALFPAFVRAQRRNPATGLYDANTLWDFLTRAPESLHIFMMIFSDGGIPDGYRHMPGYAIHTYEVVSEAGEHRYVRFHLLPDAGVRTLDSQRAAYLAGFDPDYATRDLYNAIGRGEFPSWTVKIQVLTLEDVKKAGFDVFDVTKLLPLDKYPLQPLGKIVLNKNPINYFAEIEQLAFSPANLVPGILGAPDKVFEARRLAYRDAQYYRLGANFYNIPVNCPLLSGSRTYNRDGRAPVRDNGRDAPNYFPNTFHGAMPHRDDARADLIQIVEDEANNIEQATELYVNGLTKDERTRLVENILYSIGAVTRDVQQRAVKLLTLIHPELGGRVEGGLLANSSSSSSSSGTTTGRLVIATRTRDEEEYY